MNSHVWDRSSYTSNMYMYYGWGLGHMNISGDHMDWVGGHIRMLEGHMGRVGDPENMLE